MARILLIEDNVEVAKVFAEALEEAGHTVDLAAAAYGAVQRACRHMPDLVLMDLMLQGANGAVAALALKGLGSLAPVICVTGGQMAIDDDVMVRAGFAKIMKKPLFASDLLAEVEHWLTLPDAV